LPLADIGLKNGGLKKEKVDCGYVVSFSKDLFKNFLDGIQDIGR